ncbi:thiamine pyrophosphate-binding protein [Butyrivibrio fibrisolvens]|uniref:thiamine pyrophosphate-binding protein n=1 Tax=Pseudobutyrivibrio ruminis TaxID=46206 RepID=UPI00041547FF|nr:thiamine pyrophosphate-binding protein [Pseudobutyrivibrio ruminis]MDC7278830.1 thiamine pyrophosphate-binding protein [Butyrivibrio fibrisolvens]
MKVSDYIVEFLIDRGIEHVFGYPGGMVTHLMDSFSKYQDQISAHVTYHEQGAAFAACGYAQISGKTGIAYATSGPGATNLITGICNAYMDSIPTVFITGQVNSFEQKENMNVRQRGFQETDIVSMVSQCTKYSARVNSPELIKYELEKAFFIANEGRKGPVLLDVAMDVTRGDIEPGKLQPYNVQKEIKKSIDKATLKNIEKEIKSAQRPVLVIGNGLERKDKNFEYIKSMGIPVVSSMLAVDCAAGLENYYGFIGAYGDRTANFIVAKSDLVIAVGSRLDIRQVGAKRMNFAPTANLIRIDIDTGELEYKVHNDELPVVADSELAIEQISEVFENQKDKYNNWISICEEIKCKLFGMDNRLPNQFVSKISEYIDGESVITTDVGQNQVWVAQSFNLKVGQRILFSGGHGAMGYSLPAAIGACYGANKKVYSFNGDGGIQMNIQELQTVCRDKLPVKIFVFNNNALGMIRHFQEMYFNNNFFQTVDEGGFSSPNFEGIAGAYGLKYYCISKIGQVDAVKEALNDDYPCLFEIKINENTYVFPKLEFGKPNQDQEPLIDRNLFEELMRL